MKTSKFLYNYTKFFNILVRIEPDNEYYDGEKDQDRDGPAAADSWNFFHVTERKIVYTRLIPIFFYLKKALFILFLTRTFSAFWHNTRIQNN